MNKIEKAIVENGKRLLFEYLKGEVENYKTKINAIDSKKEFFDLFNSGIIFDIDKIKLHTVEIMVKHLQKKDKKQDKNKI